VQAAVPEPAPPVGVAAAALAAPDAELAAEPTGTEADVDDAAHPALSTPAASSGRVSSAFFTRSPIA
jgi:hypothetical protein